jgi:hypothetical protein
VTGPACRPEPGPSPLRRLTRFEYDNTLRDLLGPTVVGASPSADFPAEEVVDGFNNNASALGVSALLAERYHATALALAARATTPAELPRLLGCDPARGAEDTCARTFIERFGRRAFRRPLTAAETQRFSALYQQAKTSWDFRTAIEVVLGATLQAPAFLYRVESPAAGPVDGWELASRLSYLFWGTMPDEALFEEAARGRLGTPAAVEVQARRLLADPRARPQLRAFVSQWLHLEDVQGLSKDVKVYPAFAPEVGPLLAEETHRFVESVFWEGDGKLRTLLTAPHSVRNGRLAQFYGEPGPTGTFARAALDPTRRAGLLTQASFLASHAKPNDSSPIMRGTFVRHQLLCEHLPDPPDNVVITVPAPDPRLTTRERFAQHASDPACAGCHALIDPVGLGFEHYDGVGRFRTSENGRPVDARGALHGTDVPGPFEGAIELGAKLAGSGQVRGCAVKLWFRFAHGRTETEADGCALAELGRAFDASDGDLRELLVLLTRSPAFLQRSSTASTQETP